MKGRELARLAEVAGKRGRCAGDGRGGPAGPGAPSLPPSKGLHFGIWTTIVSVNSVYRNSHKGPIAKFLAAMMKPWASKLEFNEMFGRYIDLH